MRILFNIEERVEVRLTKAGLKVWAENSGQPFDPAKLETLGFSKSVTLSIRELLKIFGPTFRSERNPQLFENNDLTLLIGYGGRV